MESEDLDKFMAEIEDPYSIVISKNEPKTGEAMSEKLTKNNLKAELQRRIDYFEETYGFNSETGNQEMEGKSHHLAICFGRYRALMEEKWQIENNLFMGGYCS